ncbi:MAG: rRNA maturation RNase YbeY, partial [Planctomycetaceae bacterium]
SGKGPHINCEISCPTMPWEIDIVSQQSAFTVNTDLLQTAVSTVLRQEKLVSAIVSISIVDNQTIHRINRQYLQHDYPTDVISFQLGFDESELPPDDQEDPLDDEPLPEPSKNDSDQLPAAGAAIEGEIIASAEMAAQMALAGNWSADAELALYVVHGLLHLCGYDDLTPADRSVMKSREILALNTLGFHPVYSEDQPDA